MPIVPLRQVKPANSDPYAHISGRQRTRAQTPPAQPIAEALASEAKPDYEIGYCKPPAHSRFKPGQSGNPKGRPKGAKGLKTIVRDALTDKVVVRTAQGPKRMTKIKALFAKTIELAFAGNMRALQVLMQYYQQSVAETVATSKAAPETAPLDTHDLAIIEEMRALLRAEVEEPS